LSPEPLVLANVGAEEGDAAPPGAAEPRVRTLARLFEGLFREPRPFAWLELGQGRAAAWLHTSEAEARAQAAGATLAGAPPEVVRRVHDKAFAHRVAEATGWVPEPLRGGIHVLEPAELVDADRALAHIARSVTEGPAFAGGRFTLKPRWGTSARGRVAGALAGDGTLVGQGGEDAAALRGALARLAERGGATLEPWLERRGDFSTQLHVGEDGVTLLGTLEQVTAASGSVAGHRGTVDSRGRVTSGSSHDETLREAALALALAAREEGYVGACGVDAFAFEAPGGPWLRAASELNARFTLGTVVLVAVRRTLPQLRGELGLSPGEHFHFYFALDAPSPGWPDPTPGAGCRVSLAAEGDPLRPALWVERDPEALVRVLGPAAD
jgi:hypothetical protein